ncbi:MAG: hypothetical protein ACRDZ1_04570 [Acidimicrobiia bacterium]
MPSMPFYFVGKGAQFEMIDRQFGGETAKYLAAYDTALQRLESDRLVDLARAHAHDEPGRSAGLTEGDVEHFEEDWIGHWGEYPVEEVMRAGFKKAITLAREKRKPIESLWVCANENSFHVYVCDGPLQITVLVFTPPPLEHVHEDALSEEEPLWVVKARDEWDHGEVESTTRRGEHDIIVKQLLRAPQSEEHHPRSGAS